MAKKEVKEEIKEEVKEVLPITELVIDSGRADINEIVAKLNEIIKRLN